jgi:hypothetical protein
MNEIDVGSLSTSQVSSDGHLIRLNFLDARGYAVAMNLTSDSVQQLLMTLPRLLSRALQTQHADDSVRAVFPLSDWRLETAAGSRNLILTMKTPDGFEVAFSVSARALAQISSAVENRGSLKGRGRADLAS